MPSSNVLETLAPPPFRIALVDSSGRIDGSWKQWIQQLFIRVGQSIALNNKQLEQLQQEELDDINTAIAMLQLAVTTINSVDVIQNADIVKLKAQVEGLSLEPAA